MKKLVILSLCISALLFSNSLFAQKIGVEDVAYRRSSLCMIMMESDGLPNSNVIREAFVNLPIPEKYNDHNIEVRHFKPNQYKVDEEAIAAYQAAVAAGIEAGAKGDAKDAPGQKSGFNTFMKSAVSEMSGGMIDTTAKGTHAVIANKHLLEQQVSKQLFDKWFLDEEGKFSMELVKERGRYDASALDVQQAKSSVRGMGILEDAGEELISNTFVVVSNYRFLSKEELQAEMDKMAQGAAAVAGAIGGSGVGQWAKLGADVFSAASKLAMGAGYYVRATSYLFQLTWNDEVAYMFYSDLWDNHEAYNASDIFSLHYIGEETGWANVKEGIFTDKSQEELIRIATVNATDEVLAKLEQKYDVFKTKTPILTTSPMTAQIGLKEGVKPGQKYEVLEQIVDPESGRTIYKRKGVIKADKKVWDNRYMADEELSAAGKEQSINATYFKGKIKDAYPGMLLRQIK